LALKKCNREITVPNKPDESVKKLVRDTLLRGYDIYPKHLFLFLATRVNRK